MALIGNIIAQAFAGNPASVNYIMFVSAFSMVSLFYLFPASWSETLRGHPIIMFIVDMLNAIFFLVGGIVLAARLEAHSCSNDVGSSVYVIPLGEIVLSSCANRPLENSTILEPTTSPTALTSTVKSAAARPKPLPRSSGSRGLVTLRR